MSIAERLESLTRAYLSPPVARRVKVLAVHPRYWAQRRACRQGYREYGHLYPQKVLFIAGLPKSGTTWLERMISSYPGFHELLIPDVERFAQSPEAGPGYDLEYDLPEDMFSRFREMLVLTKMHVPGSRHNVDVLHRAGVRYAIIYRDLRDVAVSLVFYVRQTPWHPHHARLADASVEEGLQFFADHLLDIYARWIRSWRENRDPAESLELRYEDVLADPESAVASVAGLFELDASPERVREIVAAHSFERLSRGRTPGREDASSFFRKGVAGDWKNHFTPKLVTEYKERIGDLLVELGYENDLSW
jgi:hypothetical protein